jgi:hypothetical protein
MAVQSATHQRRALELLAVSGKQGCTEAFLLASQPRKSSARVLAAKTDYISLRLAGGRSGVSGMQSKRKLCPLGQLGG